MNNFCIPGTHPARLGGFMRGSEKVFDQKSKTRVMHGDLNMRRSVLIDNLNIRGGASIQTADSRNVADNDLLHVASAQRRQGITSQGRFVAIAMALALSACATTAPVHTDDAKRQDALRQYGTPISKAVTRNDFTVRVDVQEAQFVHYVCVSVFADIVKRSVDADVAPIAQGAQVRGCSVWHRDERRLDIYVVEPQYIEDLQGFATIGHELWHGVRGAFHK